MLNFNLHNCANLKYLPSAILIDIWTLQHLNIEWCEVLDWIGCTMQWIPSCIIICLSEELKVAWLEIVCGLVVLTKSKIFQTFKHMKFFPKEFYNLKFLVYFKLSWNDNLEELPNSKRGATSAQVAQFKIFCKFSMYSLCSG